MTLGMSFLGEFRATVALMKICWPGKTGLILFIYLFILMGNVCIVLSDQTRSSPASLGKDRMDAALHSTCLKTPGVPWHTPIAQVRCCKAAQQQKHLKKAYNPEVMNCIIPHIFELLPPNTHQLGPIKITTGMDPKLSLWKSFTSNHLTGPSHSLPYSQEAK